MVFPCHTLKEVKIVSKCFIHCHSVLHMVSLGLTYYTQEEVYIFWSSFQQARVLYTHMYIGW